jgi:hypothetical protein
MNSNMGVKYCFELALSSSFRMCVDRQFWLKKKNKGCDFEGQFVFIDP